jgi:carbonic anhydrase
MITAREAFERLRDGNRHFANGLSRGFDMRSAQERRIELVEGQTPLAVVLGCSDSRVPVEIIFDQHLGDLFVIRVAGNIVAPSQVGSVEFAAERFGTRLVVVLGHSRCGAVEATVDELRSATHEHSRGLRSIVNRIRPGVADLVSSNPRLDRAALVQRAVRANVRASVDHLRHGSDVLEELIATEGLHIVGAEYSLETGVVDFFDEPPLTERGSSTSLAT